MLVAAAVTAALFAGTDARAAEVFGGVFAHDVKTGITASGIEDGLDLQLGYRGERFGNSANQWVPAPYVFVSVNSAGDTNFAAAGLSWKFGRRLYFRPGIGIAVHDGPKHVDPGDDRIDFGSRILFEPEAAVGYQFTQNVSAEVAIVHLSHAKLFSSQNPGIDNIGVRVNYRF
ncbi:MAG TPA: acyloxyacyl hydrolase [Allosphingosinicella sp.]